MATGTWIVTSPARWKVNTTGYVGPTFRSSLSPVSTTCAVVVPGASWPVVGAAAPARPAARGEPDHGSGVVQRRGEGAGAAPGAAPERREEFSPGLDKELLALIQATAEVELKNADAPGQ